MAQITYNGVAVTTTDRRTSDREGKKYQRTVTYKGGTRTVHYGDPDMNMRRTNDDARANFLSRHSCDTKKDPFAPGFWACYDWANPDVETTQEALVFNPIQEGETITGHEWEVTIIGANSDGSNIATVNGQPAIMSKNGRYYLCSGLQRDASMWENSPVCDNHQSEKQFEVSGGMRSPKNEWVGEINGVFWDSSTNRLKARLVLVDDAVASKLKNAYIRGAMANVGLSIDAYPNVIGTANNMPVVDGFERVRSLDIVMNPAAGGAFNRVTASHMENLIMDEEKDKTEEMASGGDAPVTVSGFGDALKAHGVLTATNAGEIIAPIVAGEIKKAMTSTEEPEKEGDYKNDDKKESEDVARQIEAFKKEMAIDRAGVALDKRLQEANLGKLEAPIRRLFEGRIFEADELEKAINEMKTIQESFDTSGKPNGAGSRPSVLFDEGDKYQLGIMRLIMGDRAFEGLKASNLDPDVAKRVSESTALKAWQKSGHSEFGRFRSLADATYQWFGGDLLTNSRAYEAATTSSLSTVVKNTVNIMLAADFSQREMWWKDIVTEEEVETIDQATLARVHGLGSLSTVNEGDAYTSLVIKDEEETASFVKKGGFVEVTLEALMRDKVNAIRQIPRKLADTWYNTLSDLVAGVFTVNSGAGPVLSDTGALFNATALTTAGGHANLLTTAFSYSQLVAIETAMMKQTDNVLGTGRRLTQNRVKHLLVPVDLLAAAERVRDSTLVPDQDAGGGTTLNIQSRNKFQNRINVVGVPSWTDTNNFATVADKSVTPSIYLIFPRGRRTPEIFSAGDETTGSMFTNDTMRWKTRVMTYRFSSTYDCAPVADWRGLHKSNVA